MNNIYIEFIIKKFSLLENSEYILLIFLFVLFLSIFFSFLNVSFTSKKNTVEQNKLLTIRAAENVIRILPPLNVKKSEINMSIKIIKRVCKQYK